MYYNIKSMINKFISQKGVISLSVLLVFLVPLSSSIIFSKINSISNIYFIENNINSVLNGKTKYFWSNLTQSEQNKFINYSDFKEFIQSKYSPLSININKIKYITKNTLKINFSLKNSNSNIRIPQYYNTHYFTFTINKHDKFTNVGLFSLNTPIIIYYARQYNRIIKIPIMMLHRVAPQYPSRQNYSSEYAYKLDYYLTLTTEDFKLQLQYLKTHDYHTIDMNTLYNNYYYNFPLPKNPIILTFDDGRESAFQYAYPLLLKYHDIAVFNIITGFVGSKTKTHKYMSWKQIKQMYLHGMEIESHTVTHLALGNLTLGEMNYQIIVSKSVLEKKLGNSVQFIAYPSGSPFRSNNIKKEIILSSRLKYYGYIAGLVDDNFNKDIQNLKNSYSLYRIRDSNLSLSEFIALITGNIT